jgi:dienelactone hydrolase
MAISRREFCEGVIAAAGLPATAPAHPYAAETGIQGPAVARTGSHLGSLYRFVQGQADRSPLELSFLRPEFKNLQQWQQSARARVFEHLFYAPPRVAPQPILVRRTDKGDYIEEYLTFQTTPDLRVPAYVLVPRKARLPAPGIVALHSHDGVYLWGKEKLVEDDREHPYLTSFKRRSYGGKSIAAELARQGYVVIAIDMFYWGERRLILDDDPASYRERPAAITEQEIQSFNQRASQNESLVGRSLFTAGITWPGVVLWDDIRTLDYLAARPEVDASRLGCVGLSVGGYRSFLLAALDERIKAAVDVGWMTSFASQLREHVINTVGL